MNLDLLLRGLKRCDVVVGKTETLDRVSRFDLRHPIVRVRQNYFFSELKKVSILPWVRPSTNLMWIIRSVFYLDDGRVFYHDCALTGSAKAALDRAYLIGAKEVLETVVAQKQHIVEVRA